MAEEKLFEGQIKKHFHSVGIYPAGYPTDRMNAPMVGWYTKIWGGGFQRSTQAAGSGFSSIRKGLTNSKI